MSAAAAQMNFRLKPSVKEGGDQAIARMGITPTEFVRSIWEKLAAGGSERAQLEELVLGRVAAEGDANPRMEALARARQLYADGMARLGIDPAAVPVEPERTDEDLYLDALTARMRERGTW